MGRSQRQTRQEQGDLTGVPPSEDADSGTPPDAINLFYIDIDRACLHLVPAREAWEHLVLPLGFDEHGALRCVTTRANIADAMATLQRQLDVPFSLGVTELVPLEQFIAQLYGYEGVAA